MRASTAWADESFQEHDTTVGSPVHQRRQERARAYCLHQLVLELHGFGVEQLFMEARQPTLNTRDVTTMQHARYTLPKGTRFRIDHLDRRSHLIVTAGWVAEPETWSEQPIS